VYRDKAIEEILGKFKSGVGARLRANGAAQVVHGGGRQAVPQGTPLPRAMPREVMLQQEGTGTRHAVLDRYRAQIDRLVRARRSA
jgi:hypothetical protein